MLNQLFWFVSTYMYLSIMCCYYIKFLYTCIVFWGVNSFCVFFCVSFSFIFFVVMELPAVHSHLLLQLQISCLQRLPALELSKKSFFFLNKICLRTFNISQLPVKVTSNNPPVSEITQRKRQTEFLQIVFITFLYQVYLNNYALNGKL